MGEEREYKAVRETGQEPAYGTDRYTEDEYSNIDMKLTGMLLRLYMGQSGYTAKEIQNFLHLSCPQPIYRWMSGKVLPSVNHLYVLSRLFGCHMEALLATERDGQVIRSLWGLDRVLLIRWLWVVG
ncbi:MAG: helix-turn-helix transcriptional regulator [Lachnospiraceae bacterium]|jgi:hypothetical protein|nr:helix-turn-helix transcriptional regulator [Lachnospiraceae bacterium]